MSSALGPSRIRLHPRQDTLHISRGRTALGMNQHGGIDPANQRHGLFVYQTRMLSRYSWTIDGKPPRLSAENCIWSSQVLGR